MKIYGQPIIADSVDVALLSFIVSCLVTAGTLLLFMVVS